MHSPQRGSLPASSAASWPWKRLEHHSSALHSYIHTHIAELSALSATTSWDQNVAAAAIDAQNGRRLEALGRESDSVDVGHNSQW